MDLSCTLLDVDAHEPCGCTFAGIAPRVDLPLTYISVAHKIHAHRPLQRGQCMAEEHELDWGDATRQPTEVQGTRSGHRSSTVEFRALSLLSHASKTGHDSCKMPCAQCDEYCLVDRGQLWRDTVACPCPCQYTLQRVPTTCNLVRQTDLTTREGLHCH